MLDLLNRETRYDKQIKEKSSETSLDVMSIKETNSSKTNGAQVNRGSRFSCLTEK